MNELLTKSALELADLLASGDVTSVELTTACLDRIDALLPTLPLAMLLASWSAGGGA